MPTGDYERYRQQLDAQLRSDVELIYEAYRAKLRAYETVVHARGEDWSPLPPAELPFALPPVPVAPAPPTWAPSASPISAAPAAPVAPPAAAERSRAHEVGDAFLEIWPQLPEVFDRDDVVRLLGFEPRRSTLHRILLHHVRSEKTLKVEEGPGGRYLQRYRKLRNPD